MARATGLTDILEPGEPELIATGLVFTEGPVWHPDGYLVFSDPGGDTQWKVNPGEKPALIRRGESPDGSTIDIKGRLITCDQNGRKVVEVREDRSIRVLADSHQGKRLNMCNDVVGHADGSLYFSDPDWALDPNEREIGSPAVWRLSPSGSLTLLTREVAFPNGLAFSPDESLLYVVDTRPDPHIKVFDVGSDGTLAKCRRFADIPYIKSPEGMTFVHPVTKKPRAAREVGGVPDGVKVDVKGRVFCTGTHGIWVFEPAGALVGIIRTPELPANIAFGDNDWRSLYICARTSVYRVRLKIPGMPVPPTRVLTRRAKEPTGRSNTGVASVEE